MKRILLAFALTAAACGPHGASTSTNSASSTVSAAASSGPARLETLVNPPRGIDAALCTPDGAWCATKTPQVDGYVFSYHSRPIATWRSSEIGPDLWTRIIRTPRNDGGEDVLVGIATTQTQSYSGGGGQAVHVGLYPLSSNSPVTTWPQAVVTVPTDASIDIRACFSHADVRARRDACSDQYNFTGTLTLDNTTSPAKLVLITEATTYPGHLSRNEDNTHTLAASDLKTVRDETCSYHRVFTWNAGTHAYIPDAPLPACEDYLQP